jgi:CRP-like cAMP-binding protein
MYDPLIKYINSFVTSPLTGSEIELIKNAFVPKKLRKKHYLLQEGDVCKYYAFIVKGAMRLYSVDNEGVEHIVGLFIENWWAADRESWIMLTQSRYNIDAWEDTEVLLITRSDFMNLWNSVPAWVEMSRKLDERNFIAGQKRVHASLNFTVEKRYADLEERYPEFLQRFPMHIIASYIGIAKETLSRARRQPVKK